MSSPAISTDHHEHDLPFIRKYVFSTDHKVIGLQFLFTTLVFLLIGGLLAMLIRLQLGWPFQELPVIGALLFSGGGNVMAPEQYIGLVTMHGTIMIFFFIIPILSGAFGNFLIPLQIGAPDMAFPRINLLSYWILWPAFIMILVALFVETGPPAAGWTSYAPLSALPNAVPGSGLGQTLWIISLLFVGTGSILGALNYITTILLMRAPGMTLFRMPMTTWALLITAILVLLATPVLTSALIMLLMDRTAGTHFFLPSGGGTPLLWQHLFWFYSHPAVYIMILPAMGMVSDILATFARKPLFGYKAMIFSIVGIAGLGFIVWGHHMFVSGMNPLLGTTFMLSTMVIAVPSSIKTFNWLATLWGGNIRFTTAMLNAIAFVAMFIIGGLSGIFSAATPVDIFIHDTYFIVGHLHYVLFGGSLFGAFAAIYFWFPKMFGRTLNDRLGKIHFILTFIAFNLVFFPMFILGVNGMPRRLADPYVYQLWAPLQGLNQFMTIFALALGLAQLIFVANVAYSLFKGKKAEANPWRANTLEWTAASSPPLAHGNFETIPKVYRGPYEYSSPEVKEDWYPQDLPPATPQREAPERVRVPATPAK
jgi:cytochrome c oxidase subunit 1